jgi:hypothetical protein
MSTDVSKVRAASNIRAMSGQNKSRRMSWAGHVARMGEERKLYKDLVGKSEGKRPLGRRSHRWDNGIRMDLGEIVWGV